MLVYIFMHIYVRLYIYVYISMRDLAGKRIGFCDNKIYTLRESDTVTLDMSWKYLNDWTFAF